MEEWLKQMAAATVQLQQSMVTQQASMVTQQRATDALREVTEASMATQQASVERLATDAEKDRKMLAEVVQKLAERSSEAAGAGPSSQAVVRASHFLQKMAPSDDVEAFLLSFERTAEREGWSKDRWAGLLAPFLTGEPQKAYFDLTPADAGNYDKLKAEILARLGVTTAVRAQRVYSWQYQEGRPARSQMHDLVQLATKWLQPGVLTGAQMVERFVLDRFLRALPEELQRWVSHGDPKTAEQLVEMVERYTVVEDLLSAGRQSSRATRFPSSKGDVSRNPGTSTVLRRGRFPAAVQGLPPTVVTPQRGGAIQCWRCSAWGHTRAQCPMQEEPMQCDMIRRVSFFAQEVCLAGRQENFICRVSINQVPTDALLDSGSMVTMVHADLVTDITTVLRPLKVVCIHGDTKVYPVVPVSIATDCGTVSHAVGVVRQLMCKVILGRDFPLFWELWENVKSVMLKGSENNVAPDVPPIKSDVTNICENMSENVLLQDEKNVTDHPCRDPEQFSEGGDDSPLQIMLGEGDE